VLGVCVLVVWRRLARCVRSMVLCVVLPVPTYNDIYNYQCYQWQHKCDYIYAARMLLELLQHHARWMESCL
jgi:hypothetical protein